MPTFRFRRLVNAALALSFLAAAVSGIVLFLRPEGSLARWTGWAVFGLDKRRWEAVHIVLVLLALIASAAHVWLNWRPLVMSVLGRDPTRQAGRWRVEIAPEFVVAAGIVLLACSAAVVPWQPATALIGVRTLIKDGKVAAHVMPPAPDADKLTFRELCKAAEVGRTAGGRERPGARHRNPGAVTDNRGHRAEAWRDP